METICPICNRIIGEDYLFCPSCGLPKRISSKRRFEFELPDSNANLLVNTRPEFSPYKIFDYQICDLCGSPNPFGAKYCRECGISIEFQAKDKNGHGWVDLGLSVLWSTETIEGLFLWNHSKLVLSISSDMSSYRNIEIDNKDIATAKWGAKWRTPTKDEFEELIKKCKWKKIFLPSPEKLALHVTGPNGNWINIPVTGHAGCLCSINAFAYEPENAHSECCFWTSSEYVSLEHQRLSQRYAYAFSFIGYHGFNGRKLTAKERKKLEFDIDKGFSILPKYNYDESFEQIAQRLEKERIQKRKEDQILYEMGDDFKERIENEKEANRKRIDLWLKTPIEFNYNLEDERKNIIKRMSKIHGCAIRPVADIKWKGKL